MPPPAATPLSTTVPPHLRSLVSGGALPAPLPHCSCAPNRAWLPNQAQHPPTSRPWHELFPLPGMPFLADLSHWGLFLRIPETYFSSLKTRHELTPLSTRCLPGKLWALPADSSASPSLGVALPCSDAYCSYQMQSPPSKAGFPPRLSAAFDLFPFTEKETEVQSGPITT